MTPELIASLPDVTVLVLADGELVAVNVRAHCRQIAQAVCGQRKGLDGLILLSAMLHVRPSWAEHVWIDPLPTLDTVSDFEIWEKHQWESGETNCDNRGMIVGNR